MQPKKGKYGLWYIDGVQTAFSTEEHALEYIRLTTEKSLEEKPTQQIVSAQKSGFLGYSVFEYIFSGVLGVVFLAFLFWWNSDPSPDALAKRAEQQALNAEQRKDRDCKSETMHHVMSDKLIKERLKSPSTAKFSSYGESQAVYLGNCRVRHTGYVDAQNSFGAIVRSQYNSVTIYNQANGQYSLESLDM